jgi:hypothetical protein
MTELSLSTIANIAEIIGASTIVTGLIFGWVQLRQYRVQQRNAIASSLTQTFYNRDLAHAISLLQSVPDDVRLSELRSKGPEFVEAAVTVATSFETMGILVFQRIAPLELVVDLAGGVITSMLRKLRIFQEDLRAEQQQPSWGEWFEWLGDQIENVKGQQEPAHIRHRDWRP